MIVEIITVNPFEGDQFAGEIFREWSEKNKSRSEGHLGFAITIHQNQHISHDFSSISVFHLLDRQANICIRSRAQKVAVQKKKTYLNHRTKSCVKSPSTQTPHVIVRRKWVKALNTNECTVQQIARSEQQNPYSSNISNGNNKLCLRCAVLCLLCDGDARTKSPIISCT